MSEEKTKTLKEIVDPEATEVSLVDSPANRTPFLIIKSESGQTLKLPLEKEAIEKLSEDAELCASLFTQVHELLKNADSDMEATFPEAIKTEISKALDHWKSFAPETKETEEVVTKGISEIEGFNQAVQVIRQDLWEIADSLNSTPESASEMLNSAAEKLNGLIADVEKAQSVFSNTPAMVIAADDLKKCREGLPADNESVEKVVSLVKELEYKLRPASSIQKAFDAFVSDSEARIKALEDKNLRLQKALKEAIEIAKAKATSLRKSNPIVVRPTPQSAEESVLSNTPAMPQPTNVWGGDLAAEVEAEELAAKSGR